MSFDEPTTLDRMRKLLKTAPSVSRASTPSLFARARVIVGTYNSTYYSEFGATCPALRRGLRAVYSALVSVLYYSERYLMYCTIAPPYRLLFLTRDVGCQITTIILHEFQENAN